MIIFGTIMAMLLGLGWGVVGGKLTDEHPENPLAWAVLFFGFAMMIGGTFNFIMMALGAYSSCG